MKIKEKEVKSILTKSPAHHGFTASPYSGCQHNCMYCYAKYLPEWTGHEGERWGEYVDIKNWKPLTEKQKKNLHGKGVFISSATDPYQPLERKYRRTRKLLTELVGLGMNVLVVTKSANVLDDLNLFKELDATVALSINTHDEFFRSVMDNASSIGDRIKALEVMHGENIHTACFISPIFPGITDAPKIIEEVTGKCDTVYLEHLVLQDPYKGPVLYFIKMNYPDLYPYYDRLFNKGDLNEWWEYDNYMEEWARENGFKYAYTKFPKEHLTGKPTIVNFRGHKGK